MGVTTDPSDPRLTRGTDDKPAPQADAYLVLSDDERGKGFVRPLRRSYRHVGTPGPRFFPLRDLTAGEQERYAAQRYVAFEAYPADEAPVTGRFWTQAQLDESGEGCQSVTTMGTAIAETYARQPGFYGATYCVGCYRHLKVGPDGEFTWISADGRDTSERVGT